MRAARAQRGVAQAQVVQAGLLPDPVLSASYNLLLGGPGVANAIGTTLSGDITALITLSARRRAAQEAALQVDASLVWDISMPAAGGLFCGTGARPTEQPITGPIGDALLGRLLDVMARLRGNPYRRTRPGAESTATRPHRPKVRPDGPMPFD